MKMLLLNFYLLAFSQLAYTLEIIDVLEELQWKSFNLVVRWQHKSKDYINLFKDLSFYWKYQNFDQYECSKGENIILIEPTSKEAAKCITNATFPFSVLIMNMTERLELNSSSGFYLANSHLETCYHVSKTICNQNRFNLTGLAIRGVFNYAPDKEHEMTQNILRELQKSLNFTLTLDLTKYPNDWGLGPTNSTDWSNKTAYPGMFGEFLNDDKFSILGNHYKISYYRYLVADFIHPTLPYRERLFTNLALSTKVADWSFFMRPFQPRVWAFICFFLGLAMILGIISNKKHANKSKNCFACSASFLYVLAFSYYSASQTMFFATKNEFPVQTLEDAIMAYPKYKLVIIKAHDLTIREKASDGIDLYVQLLNKINNGYEYYMSSVEDGIEVIDKIPGTILLAADIYLSGIINHKYKGRKAFFALKSYVSKLGGLFVKKHSPLRSSLNYAALRLQESGSLEQIEAPLKLYSKSQNTQIQLNQEEESFSLDFFNLFTCFLAFAVFMLCALLTLLFEIKKYKH